MSTASSDARAHVRGLAGLVWQRRWIRTIAYLSALALVLRAVLAIALPHTLDAVADAHGLRCEYSDLSLSVSDGTVEIRDLRLDERDSPRVDSEHADDVEPLLGVEYVWLDVTLWRLLLGELSVDRAEFDGVRVHLDLDPQQQAPWLTVLGLDSPTSETPSGSDQETSPAEELDFTSPLELRDLRLNGIVVHVQDRSVDPPIDARVVAELRLDDASPERHTFELNATCPELFDRLHVEALVDGRVRQLTASSRADFAGLRSAPLRAYLEALGIDAPSSRLDGRAALDVSVGPRPGSPHDCQARFELHDIVLEGDGELIAALDRFEVHTESLRFDAPTDVAFSMSARAPGIVASIAWSGRGRVDANELDAVASVTADGVAPTRLERTLARAGLAAELRDGGFGARVHVSGRLEPQGCVRGRVELGEIAWYDADELFALDRLAVEDVEVRFDPLQIRVSNLDIDGMRAQVSRDAAGGWHAFGLTRATPANVGSEGGSIPGRAPATAHGGRSHHAAHESLVALPRVEIGRVNWHGNSLRLTDQSIDPALELVVTDVGATLDGLVIGAPSRVPARLHAWLAIDRVLDELTLHGSVQSMSRALDFDAELSLRARGVHTIAVADSFTKLGIEPALVDATLTADATLRACAVQDGWNLECATERVELREGAELLAGLRALRIGDTAISHAGAHVGRVELQGATLAAERDPRGGFGVGGLRVTTPAADAALDVAGDARRSLATLVGLIQVALPPIAVDSIVIEDASASWRDRTVTPVVDCTAVLNARIGSLSTRALRPTQIEVAVTVPGVLTEATLSSELTLAHDRASARGRVSARGVDAHPLAGYLPAGLSPDVADGRFDAVFALALEPAPEGGRRMHAELGPLEWREGARRWAGFERATIEVRRADAVANRLDVGEVSLKGLELEVERSSPSTWSALGLAVDSSARAPAPPIDREPAGRAAASAAVRASELPIVTLGTFALELARLEIVDRSRPGAAPIVASARIATPEGLVVLEPNATTLPPIRCAVRGAVEPVIGAYEIDLTLAPYRDPVEADLTLAAREISGRGLIALLPELAAHVDGGGSTAGELTARTSLELALDRRAATRFDFAQPFGAKFAVEELQYRAEPRGTVLAGLDALRVDAARFDPRTGELAIQDIEFDRPIARIERTNAGLAFAGLVLRNTPLDTGATTEPATVRAPIEASAPARTQAQSSPPEELLDDDVGSPPDLSIARISVAGLDFVARDTTLTPPLEIGLDALDVELRKFSTRDLRAGKPIQFAGALGSAKLPMPARGQSDAPRESAAGAAGATPAQTAQPGAGLEQRPLFDEIAFAGRIAIVPHLDGWATVDVSAFELTALSPLAKSFGVTIGNGVLDEQLRLRFQGTRGAPSVTVDSRSTFSSLTLSERAGGPIGRTLALPAPLDMVLFLLEDYEGEHKVPISVRLTDASLSFGQVARASAGAAASVIATAVASSPLRVVGSVTDLFGLTRGEEPAPSAAAVTISFDVGAASERDDNQRAIGQIRARLEARPEQVVVLAHEFSGEDLVRAARLGNPNFDDCLQFSRQLRAKRAELERQRAETAATARAQLALGDADGAARSIERVRTLEADIGANENALDRLHELLKPASERKSAGRSRAAAMAIASERVERVRQSLLDANIPPEQIEVRQVRVRASKDLGGGAVVLDLRERERR